MARVEIMQKSTPPSRTAATLALILLAAPAFAADDTPTVTTHGTARDRLPNTVADVQLGIETRGRTVAEVQAALATGSAPLIAFLRTTSAERTRTEGVSVDPELDPNPIRGQPPRILGYAGRLSVSFQIEAAKLGPVLTDALGHGANTIQGIAQHPREAEVDAARLRLAAAATRIALDLARAVAEAAGMKPGPPRQITVDGAQSYPRARMAAPAMLMAAAPAPPQIATESGDSEVTATVTATITLLPP